MIIQYLGSGAAEGVPALFCDCEVCRESRAKGGRNLRTRSQTLIDGRLLIDFPCDTLAHLNREGLNLCNIKNCLITHIHEDHFYPLDMAYPRPGFSHPPAGYSFTVYGSPDIKKDMAWVEDQTHGVVKAVAKEAFVPFVVDGYTVTALPANHSTDHPYIYIITDGEKTLLYAHDTGRFPGETMEYIEKSGVKFDLVSLDCTEGAAESLGYEGHMCLGYDRLTRDWLKAIGAAGEDTLFVMNHFSHNGVRGTYDSLAEEAGAEGFTVSYDGMIVEI